MMMIGLILWTIFLTWLISIGYPSQEMRRDHSGNSVYYFVWGLLVIGLLLGHYHFMAMSGYATPALISDAIGVGVGVLWIWGMWRYRQKEIQSQYSESSHFLHTRRQ